MIGNVLTRCFNHECGVVKTGKRHALCVASAVVFAVIGAGAHAADAPNGDPQAQSASAEWSDPLLNQPYVDMDEWRDEPVRHRYVHGGFKGTEAKFSFYFPPKEQYGGRFFEAASPVPQSENSAQKAKGESNNIAFSASSGAYFVETNQGGAAGGAIASERDPALAGYRVNAAAAQYSRLLAEQMYGLKRPYGYLFGGSGGAFRTVAGVENTRGVWDGSVPFVLGTPLTLPSMLTVRLNAEHMLEGKFPAINDAVDVGGSGDMYAGLDPDQRYALQEATRMGGNPKMWVAYQSLTFGVYPVLIGNILKYDPTYVHDFWTVPGYGGTNPSQFLKKAHYEHQTVITKLITPDEADAMHLKLTRQLGEIPSTEAWQGLLSQGGQMIAAIQLESMPDGDPQGAVMTIKSGAAAGETIRIDNTSGNIVPLTFGLGGVDPHMLMKLKPGDKVQVDNSTFLAVLQYHRFQVPPKSKYPDFHAWDQYLGPDGRPIFPQRPVLEGPLFAKGGGGVDDLENGRFEGKMIVVQSMVDEGHFPWQADWYRTQVNKHFGAKTDDHFRIWYTDNAMHTSAANVAYPDHFISYLGIVQQALRDVSAWVEKGTPPPASTRYKLADNQVILAPTAKERKGVQPVVSLRVNGAKRAQVKAGQPVNLTASIDPPPGTGKVISAEWDFEDTGTFDTPAELVGSSDGAATVKASHVYTKPGTYFVVLHAVSQRQGDANIPYTRIQNLDRVRVVVE